MGKLKDIWAIVWKAISVLSTMAGFVPGSLMSVLTLAVGYVAKVNGLLVWMCVLSAFLGSLWVFDKMGKAKAFAAMTMMTLSALAIIGNSARQNYIDYNNYDLAFEGWDVWRDGKIGADGRVHITKLQLRMSVINLNNFPIWVRAVKHTTSIMNRNSSIGEDPNSVPEMLAPGKVIITDDDPIEVDIPTGIREKGELDFSWEYSREKEGPYRLFNFARSFEVIFNEDGTVGDRALLVPTTIIAK